MGKLSLDASSAPVKQTVDSTNFVVVPKKSASNPREASYTVAVEDMSSAPPPKTRKDSTTVISNFPSAKTTSAASSNSTPAPASNSGAALMAASGSMGKIKNVKDLPVVGKTPKRQKSSRFHVTERIELEKLPNLKGILFYNNLGIRNNFKPSVVLCCNLDN